MEPITIIAALIILIFPALVVLVEIIEKRMYISDCKKMGKKLIKVD